MTAKMALLVMDVQQGIVGRYAKSPDFLQPFERAIAAARSAQIPVIYVRVAFRPGYPEVSPRNQFFAAATQNGGFDETAEATQIHPAIAPQQGDVVLVKRRVSAFTGSDLDVVLRGLGVDTLVVSGISTSGVVLSTVREASDKDYGLIVLKDACVDGDPEVHRVLTEKVFVRQAQVTTVEEWATSVRYM